MPRHKVAQNCKLLPWLSAKADCKDGRFIQIGNSLLLSREFQSLSHGAQVTYFCMAMESAGRSNFTFPLSSAKKYGFSGTSFNRYVKELIQQNYIRLKSSGKATREANQYEFTFSWKGIN